MTDANTAVEAQKGTIASALEDTRRQLLVLGSAESAFQARAQAALDWLEDHYERTGQEDQLADLRRDRAVDWALDSRGGDVEADPNVAGSDPAEATVKYCPQCGTSVDASDCFCRACGSGLGGG